MIQEIFSYNQTLYFFFLKKQSYQFLKPFSLCICKKKKSDIRRNTWVEQRDLLSCHTALCLGKPVGSWKKEIQGSSLVYGRLNEHKAVSTDSTSIAATVLAAVILCLCASLQHLTIMFSFISRLLLLPGPQFLLIFLPSSPPFLFLYFRPLVYHLSFFCTPR